MQSSVELLKKIVQKEKELGVYDHKVLGVPIWRLRRHSIRSQYLKPRSDYDNKTNKKRLHIKSIIKGYCSSLFKLVKLFINNEQTKNLIFAFPRLAKLENLYLDKFTDPVIDYSDLKSDYLVFQRNQASSHKYPRWHSEHVIESDAIDYTAKFVGVLFFPIFFLVYAKSILRLYKKAKSFFDLNSMFLLTSSVAIGNFIVKYFVSKYLYARLKIKRVFLVNRNIFMAAIVAAKKSGVTVYEMQHGITQDESVLYTGDYDDSIDPDYFLAFGEVWKGPQFGIPVEKIINIGWAYKKRVKNIIPSKEYDSKHILVISEPAITEKILAVIKDLSNHFSDCTFHLRLHPQEGLTEKQQELIQEIPNIQLNDNSIDSVATVRWFDRIIGKNSSVLYEALSMGKKVGKLTMEGINAQRSEGTNGGEFEFIDNYKDFGNFLRAGRNTSHSKNVMYSDFNEETFNKILKEN